MSDIEKQKNNNETKEPNHLDDWDDLDDEKKDKLDHEALMEELSEEFSSGDVDETMGRLGDLGYDIDDINI